MNLIAHRGIFDNETIPENSILAFKKALDLNYPIELDVELTKDNILVVFHDTNLKRMTNYDKDINDITYEELKELKLLNTKEHIPTLKEVLKLINNKVKLYIEIKPTKDNNKICTIVNNELKDYDNFSIQSFSVRTIKWFNKHNSGIDKGLLISTNYYNKLIGRLLIKYCKPNFLSISKKVINLYNAYTNYPIIIWTITNIEELNDYKSDINTYICNKLPYKK